VAETGSADERRKGLTAADEDLVPAGLRGDRDRQDRHQVAHAGAGDEEHSHPRMMTDGLVRDREQVWLAGNTQPNRYSTSTGARRTFAGSANTAGESFEGRSF
jgi:hypothetical protein